MKRQNYTKGLLLLVLACLLLFTGCQASPPENTFSLHSLDVGQGDSTLIITPEGQSILIDGGEAQASQEIIRYLEKNQIEKIDFLIATHPHSDHIGGLPEIMDHFPIGQMIMPRVVHTSQAFENLLLAADAQNLSIQEPVPGTTYPLEENLELVILGPVKDYGDNLNNWSAVVQLRYDQKVFLFTGDAEAEAEKDILAAYDPSVLKSHYLKIGHHGSSTSSSEAFLAAVQPDVATISAGEDNSYGHPHQEVLDRLQDVSLYRTDTQGTVILYSDGLQIWSHEKPAQIPN